MHRKAATHQAVDKIDLRALDVLGTDRVDEQPYAADFADGIAFLGTILEAHAVRHPGATARLDEDPQAHFGTPLLLEQVAQLGERRVGDADQFRIAFDHFLSHVNPIIRPDFLAPATFEL